MKKIIIHFYVLDKGFELENELKATPRVEEVPFEEAATEIQKLLEKMPKYTSVLGNFKITKVKSFSPITVSTHMYSPFYSTSIRPLPVVSP